MTKRTPSTPGDAVIRAAFPTLQRKDAKKMDYKTDSTTATELAEEATAIHALLSAALRQWDVSPYDTKPQECAWQLVNAVTGILILAKQHDQHMENAFQL